MRPEFRRQFTVLRRAAGLTQTELANTLNTTRQRVSRWENCRIELTSREEEIIDALARDLAISGRDSRPMTKCCWDCRRTLNLESFAIDHSRPSGRQSCCKECSRDTSMFRRRTRGVEPRGMRQTLSSYGSELTKRDYHELSQLGDGFQFADISIGLVRQRADLTFIKNPTVRKYRKAFSNGEITEEDVRLSLRRDPELQKLLSTCESSLY